MVKNLIFFFFFWRIPNWSNPRSIADIPNSNYRPINSDSLSIRSHERNTISSLHLIQTGPACLRASVYFEVANNGFAKARPITAFIPRFSKLVPSNIRFHTAPRRNSVATRKWTPRPLPRRPSINFAIHVTRSPLSLTSFQNGQFLRHGSRKYFISGEGEANIVALA